MPAVPKVALDCAGVKTEAGTSFAMVKLFARSSFALPFYGVTMFLCPLLFEGCQPCFLSATEMFPCDAEAQQ
jgi:hypothetical protein